MSNAGGKSSFGCWVAVARRCNMRAGQRLIWKEEMSVPQNARGWWIWHGLEPSEISEHEITPETAQNDQNASNAWDKQNEMTFWHGRRVLKASGCGYPQ